MLKVNGEGSVLGRKPVFGTVGERMHTHAFILLTTSRESLPPVEGRDRGARSVVQIIYSLEGPYMGHGQHSQRGLRCRRMGRGRGCEVLKRRATLWLTHLLGSAPPPPPLVTVSSNKPRTLISRCCVAFQHITRDRRRPPAANRSHCLLLLLGGRAEYARQPACGGPTRCERDRGIPTRL